MVSSDVCPTEDAVQLFLEHLVDPLLPAKSSVRDKPTPSLQQAIAKQVHSVVLLYNYYHRKQHPELAYLPFNEFCSLIVVLRPALLAYMEFMQKLNEVELTDVDKQLSLTEKLIMDACDVCKCLDASKSIPNIEGWPITKVAILLIDNKKECCFLLFGSITSGVWSLVEKGIDTSGQSSKFTPVPTYAYNYKKRRVVKKSIKDEVRVDEAEILQVGYSAIKEATGIENTDIMLLERDTVYSHSKEKAASCFYIMQCTQLIKNEVILVPLKYLMHSLWGPLVNRSSTSSRWKITPVIDHFHVLPYSEIIRKWISREEFSNSLRDSKVTEKNIMVDNPEKESNVSKDTLTGHYSMPDIDHIESPKLKENNGSWARALSDSIKDPQEIDMDESSIFPSGNNGKSKNANTVQVGEDQEKNNLYVQYDSNGSASAAKEMNVESRRMLTTKKDTIDDLTQTTNHSNSDLEKLQILIDSKQILSQTALAALIQKRNDLALQQRTIEDEIAICDKKIQRILTDGEDEFKLKIESIIEGCNDTWVGNQERMLGEQSLPLNRKSLSEAVFISKSPCQELDGVCHENNWVLPTYHLSQSHGGFKANVTVKGVDFQCSFEGNVESNPLEARESAAAQMLTNLRSMQN